MSKNQPSKTEQSVSKSQSQQSQQAQEHGLVSIYKSMDSRQLQSAVNQQKKQREIIREFVNDQLVEGKDYGTIEGQSKSGGKFQSKPTLMKPGQEKIFSLFGLSNECERDDETLSMLSNVSNLIAYKCIVYRNDQKIAEGRGAAVVGEKQRDVNSTIKIAEKRARMDACLSLGFSEFFTQDLDDQDGPPKQSGSAPRASQRTSSRPAQKTTTKKDLMAEAFGIVKKKANFEIDREQAIEVINAVYGDDFTKINSFDDFQTLFRDLRQLDVENITTMLMNHDEALEGEVVEDESEPEPAVEAEQLPNFSEEEQS